MEDVVIYNINGKEYLLSDQISLKNNTYLYLGNIKNARDILLRKIVIDHGEEYVVRLDSDEFDEVMAAFHKKYEDLF